MELILASTTAEGLEDVKDTINEANKLLDTLEGYIPKAIEFGMSILIALIILFIGKVVINLLLKILKKFFAKTRMEVGISKFLVSFMKAGLYIILVIIICDKVGIPTASFIALIGSCGVAIGLAMQGALSNLAGGITILLVKPFKVGDYISEENNSGVEGTVINIDLFYTSLTTVDNKVILIPNGTLTASRIVNVTSNDKRRVDFKIGISYKANIDQVRKVMLDVIESCEQVIKDDDKVVLVKELAESQVIMEARVWVKTSEYFNVLCYFNEEMKKKIEEAGIEIAYNQLDVHIISQKQEQ